MGSTRRNVLYGLGYTCLALLGAGIVSINEVGAVIFGSLLLLVAGAGFVMIGLDQHLLTRTPAVQLGTAPSGAPAMVFPYSRAPVLMQALGTPVFIAWLVGAAVLSACAGHPGGAWLLGLAGLGLAVPLVPLARGKIVTGGLYLTSTGVEYRHEGTGWSVRWGDVEAVTLVDWVVLDLARSAERQDTTRVVWRRDRRYLTLPRVVAFPARYLAGGPSTVVTVIDRCLRAPQTRATLAHTYVVDQVNELART